MSRSVLLEVCANSVTSAVAAQQGGAARVELCGNLYEGGTTPSHGEILLARRLLHIKLYVLIRPRAGDFLYSDLEFETMIADTRYCIEAGCDGIVIGILNANGTVDKKRCLELIHLAKQLGVGVTFHRAFDLCAEMYQALEDVIEMGCERLLTSGGKSTAMEGSSVIAHLIQKAAGRIIIMPGSGISEHNVTDLVHFTGVTEIHASAKVRVESRMSYKNNHIILRHNLGDDHVHEATDTNRVREILKLANQ